ncbi:carbamoyltransferase HypF [Bacillus marasmi]|uniref:carbamoyltransferase HypF n=1 Tax=Bacillus marasmi TaxID=1926279 RepID=UPI0011C9364D|nr:carbamoyltransferase HypF [Bacillus marasmi]
MISAKKISVRGRVQGVGFRPFVFALADKYEMKGTVQNNMDGVKIHLEGESEQLCSFLEDLKNKAPRLSKIDSIIVNDAEIEHHCDFTIIKSERSGTSMLVIPIDSAVCDDCIEEMRNPDDFRYRYPFINCTQCGPRYTIIQELPYDRPYTTMGPFTMCPDCQKEYGDPLNRRHHAQPIACPKCGPHVLLFDSKGELLEINDPISETIRLLEKGAIIAVKGIGGYHLCCDARNEEAIQSLRIRKNRKVRPLAVMAASIDEAKKFAAVSSQEEEILKSPESPIVVLQKNHKKELADSIAPGMSTIGVMLPYTPLHHLLFENSKAKCLVMTSANPSGLPMIYTEDQVFHYLKGICDYYLIHNRVILHPVDDSVVQLNSENQDFLRRSRGYVPDPLPINRDVTGIVAFGGQQKTTFSIGRNEQIFVGPHIGDLENIETINHYKQELNHLLKWIDIPKTTAVIDAHPSYMSREIAKDYHFDELMEIQHHHAHMAACMGENEIDSEAYGIILDGTGYGSDGHIWGFEILYGDYGKFERQAHLTYTPLPGIEKAIKEPWRNAAAMLMSLLGEEGFWFANQLFPDRETQLTVLQTMMTKNINTILAGTCGRLFDAVSAMSGICHLATYDGEAAIKLSEKAVHKESIHPYSYQLIKSNQVLIFDFSKMLKEIAEDVLNQASLENISSRFHETIVRALVEVMHMMKVKYPSRNNQVVLSGGSFHNRYLRERLTVELSKLGFSVYNHQKVPCNDGGLSYGQLLVAAAIRGARTCV